MYDTPDLVLRRAERRDSEDLLAWRNDPVTRANSRNTGEIAREAHEAWLERALGDANRRIWIAESGDRKLGTVSATLSGEDSAEVSITVAPGMRGRGMGSAMLQAAVAETASQWPGRAIRAVVRPGNAASRRLFEGCGFVAVGEEEGLLVYRLGG